MKEFYLDEHSWSCPCNIEATPLQWKKMCELNPERFILFIKNRFVLITYNTCMNGGSHIDYKKELIDQIIKHNKVYDFYEINKSVDIDQNFKDFRIRNIALKKYIEQVNYIYSNSAGRKFGITTDLLYLDAIKGQDELDDNYKQALEFIEKTEYKFLIKELRDLYFANKLRNNHEAQYIKAVDHLVKEINKLTIE
jgi:hypothetical protein